MEAAKPFHSLKIFWDVDPNRIDFEDHAEYIIVRVFDRGDVEDIRRCRRFYGDMMIKKILLNARFLSEIRLSLASTIIEEPKEAFRCYTLRQSNPTLLPY